MKKGKIVMMVTMSILVISILGYLQYGRDVSVGGSHWNIFGNGSSMDVTIVANRLYICDKEKFAEQILQRCVDNSFQEVLFSYDVKGYPSELNISVYMNPTMWKLKERAFQIQYKQDLKYQYDIRDGIDKFKIEFIFD